MRFLANENVPLPSITPAFTKIDPVGPVPGTEQADLLGEPAEGDEQGMLGQDGRAICYTHRWRSFLEVDMGYHLSRLGALAFRHNINGPPFARKLR